MSAVVSPVAGTRVEPIDSYVFVRGTTATFKVTFTSEGVPITVDSGTTPSAQILEPNFLNNADVPVPNVIATISGSLVTGQTYEYEFKWDIPVTQTPLDEYIVSYKATIGGVERTYGDEYFSITPSVGSIGIKAPLYATVDDVRAKKFNIDSYLPESANTLIARNMLIEKHLRDATTKLREELALFKQRGNSENYRLFTIYYSIWSIMLAARGEDSSSVSDQNLRDWRGEWMRILAQEKRESTAQGISLGRA